MIDIEKSVLYPDLSPQEKYEIWFKKNSTNDNDFESYASDFIEKKQQELLKKQSEGVKSPDDKISKLSTISIKPNQITADIDKLNVDNDAKNYLKRLAKIESGFNPKAINQFGYKGLYQFGDSAFKTLGVNPNDYMNNVQVQHKAALDLANRNVSGLDKYYGQTINGIKLNKYNLAAAAHLAGRGNLLKVLSGRIPDFKDGNGTSIFTYLKKFEV